MREISSDEYKHGKLGISILRDYRDLSIGSEMLQTIVGNLEKSK